MDFRRQMPSPEAPSPATVPGRRRHHYRHQIHSLAYLNLDQSNGGILRNLGETGVAVQAVAPLRPGQQVFLRFDLASPRVRIEGQGRVAWADLAGQAGIEFLTLSQRCRRGLREWIFVQLLVMAQQGTHELTFQDLTFNHTKSAEAAELLFSSTSRPAIRLPQTTVAPARDRGGEIHAESIRRSRAMHLPWIPFSVSAPALSRLVDGLILLSAVLLFAVIGMAMIGAVPAWPIALALGLGVSGVFTLVYRFLFLFWFGGTPGNYVAELTDEALNGKYPEAEEQPRFR
ncbi:MAG: PilZ domain-containing protein [Terriglobales bacterium]